ncbi:MAG: hypothetical protein ACFB50_15675 [Rubrobacteraceae bacterium]
MKIKVIAGIREMDLKDPLCGAWIEFVSFPMTVTNYQVEGPDDPEEITLDNEAELVAWADATFEPEGYEIWDMVLPNDPLTTAAKVLQGQLEAVDREITAANDAGYQTSDLTHALDELWQELSSRVVVPAPLLRDVANGLEESAGRYEEDAHELEKFPAEAEFVTGYSTRAKELRAGAQTLRALASGAAATPNPDEPVAVVAIDGGTVRGVETKGGAVIEVSDHDKHSDEPLIVRRYRGTECISRQVLDD